MAGFKYQRRDPAEIEKRATQQGGEFQGIIVDEVKTYSVKKGDNFVRILPPTWKAPKNWGYDVWVHYSVGPEKATVLCLAKMPEHQACPICEARAAAERAGDEERMSDLRAIRRVVVWMIDKKEPEKGPMIWAMPWTLDRDIAAACKDAETGAVYYCDDPDKGYNISFTKTGEGRNTQYGGVQLSRKASSVDQADLGIAIAVPVPETLVWRDYDEVLALYEGPTGGKKRKPADDVDDAPAPRGGRRAAPPPEEDEDPEPEPARSGRRNAALPADEADEVENGPEPAPRTTRRRASPPPDEDEDPEPEPAPSRRGHAPHGGSAAASPDDGDDNDAVDDSPPPRRGSAASDAPSTSRADKLAAAFAARRGGR
jgi:hypothetical protein